MLTLRMIIFAGIAGICLWGLFGLLDNLKEPSLLRTAKAVAVKGCSSLDDHADAPRLCPQLLCQKALIDRKLLNVQTQFQISVEQGDSSRRLVGGRATNAGQDDRDFACVVSGLTVSEARLLEPGELASIGSRESGFEIRPER